MLLVEKSLSQLLRTAFSSTYSGPPVVGARLLRAVEALGAGAGSRGSAGAPLILLRRGTSCRECRVPVTGQWFRPVPGDVGEEEQRAGAAIPGSLQLLGSAIGRNLISPVGFPIKGVLCLALHLYVRLVWGFICWC